MFWEGSLCLFFTSLTCIHFSIHFNMISAPNITLKPFVPYNLIVAKSNGKSSSLFRMASSQHLKLFTTIFIDTLPSLVLNDTTLLGRSSYPSAHFYLVFLKASCFPVSAMALFSVLYSSSTASTSIFLLMTFKSVPQLRTLPRAREL